jgi:hypothetical protein
MKLTGVHERNNKCGNLWGCGLLRLVPVTGDNYRRSLDSVARSTIHVEVYKQ